MVSVIFFLFFYCLFLFVCILLFYLFDTEYVFKQPQVPSLFIFQNTTATVVSTHLLKGRGSYVLRSMCSCLRMLKRVRRSFSLGFKLSFHLVTSCLAQLLLCHHLYRFFCMYALSERFRKACKIHFKTLFLL